MAPPMLSVLLNQSTTGTFHQIAHSKYRAWSHFVLKTNRRCLRKGEDLFRRPKEKRMTSRERLIELNVCSFAGAHWFWHETSTHCYLSCRWTLWCSMLLIQRRQTGQRSWRGKEVSPLFCFWTSLHKLGQISHSVWVLRWFWWFVMVLHFRCKELQRAVEEMMKTLKKLSKVMFMSVYCRYCRFIWH